MNKPGSVARVAPSVKIHSGKSSWEVSKAEVIDAKLVAGTKKKAKRPKDKKETRGKEGG